MRLEKYLMNFSFFISGETHMSQRFENQIVWITGGGSGIGRACAKEFAAQGATVVVSGRRQEKLAEVVKEIEAGGGKADAVTCDVTSEESVAEAVRKIVEKHKKLDVAVANAGFGVMGTIEQLSADDWRRQLDTNVVGAAITAKAAIPELKKTKGRLALVGSVSAYVNMPGGAAYQASKHAVRAIGETLSLELKSAGVSCTTIHPGFVESDIARVDNKGVYHPEWKDRRPQKVMWKSEDAARVVVDAIFKRKREFVFTYHGIAAVWAARHLPGLTSFLIGLSSAKPQKPKVPKETKE